MLVDKTLKAIRKLRSTNLSKLKEDEDLQAQVLWYLYTAVQGALDIALKFISRLNIETPDTYSDVFRILLKEKIIPKPLANKLITMAKFRNVIAHMYLELDLDTIIDIIKNDLDDIETLIRILYDEGKKRGFDIFTF
ncbi:MAG: type VII toxin-antitoxin system HepT family RNase toxin [Candidatus Asgardarchaeia archaeon]